MAKRASDRYTTAKDMAEDLADSSRPSRHCLALCLEVPSFEPESTLESTPLPPSSRRSDSDQRPIKIVPKGLRSFDEHDADFFLELLPGPRDRDGLPESIRFWKSRIERAIPRDVPGRVDLRAVGLRQVVAGQGRAAAPAGEARPSRLHRGNPEETESRLSTGYEGSVPNCRQEGSGRFAGGISSRDGCCLRSESPAGPGSVRAVAPCERGEANTELVAALRQCDGEHVQAVVMVRDDFWMAATRSSTTWRTEPDPPAECRCRRSVRSSPCPQGAQGVRHRVRELARADGRLISRAPVAFLDQAVADLAQDGKIISVRLALFAEMMKGKPWTPATLQEVGGTQGIGLTFLEETFGASTAPPEHRFHQKAAQAVLKALLPETGTDIKGQMRSRQELLEASGYANRPRDFDDLVRILDGELRLITPTDPKGSPVKVSRPHQRSSITNLRMIMWCIHCVTGSPASSERRGEDEPNCGWRNGRRHGMPSPRTASCPHRGMGEHPAADAEEGLDRARAPHDEPRRAGARAEGA